ncbi:commd4 [Acrasis kona]|uniref:Commd4 n=1 Tax=Acrasis kona TaxID=1008807 RepID=A0AAW2YTD0_9EUKA
MKDISGIQVIDYQKALKRTEVLESVEHVRMAIASLLFIIQNAARFDVDDQKLSFELQQIGLPKESCESLSRSYKIEKDRLVAELKRQTLRLPSISELKWRVDYVLSSSKINQVNEPGVHLSMKLKGNKEPTTFEMSLDKFQVLHHELRSARDLMENIV